MIKTFAVVLLLLLSAGFLVVREIAYFGDFFVQKKENASIVATTTPVTTAPVLEPTPKKSIPLSTPKPLPIAKPLVPAVEPKKEVYSSPPFQAEQKTVQASEIRLTRDGVISWTNYYRHENGLDSLAENYLLVAAAELKLKDMFERQYFAHNAPTGEGAPAFVDKTEYQYLSVGENLALGRFAADKDLVEAWMGSPGHRANILNKNFREIGAAVGKGKIPDPDNPKILIETWLAVQIFALPSSACPHPNTVLKADIDLLQQKISDDSAKAKAIRAEIEQMDPKTEEEYKIYRSKVDEYNALVALVNSAIDSVKTKIAEYNSQVFALNSCISGT